MPDANHFFENRIEDLIKVVGSYLDKRMVKDAEDRAKSKEKERDRPREREAEPDPEPGADLGGDDGDDD